MYPTALARDTQSGNRLRWEVMVVNEVRVKDNKLEVQRRLGVHDLPPQVERAGLYVTQTRTPQDGIIVGEDSNVVGRLFVAPYDMVGRPGGIEAWSAGACFVSTVSPTTYHRCVMALAHHLGMGDLYRACWFGRGPFGTWRLFNPDTNAQASWGVDAATRFGSRPASQVFDCPELADTAADLHAALATIIRNTDFGGQRQQALVLAELSRLGQACEP